MVIRQVKQMNDEMRFMVSCFDVVISNKVQIELSLLGVLLLGYNRLKINVNMP